LASLCTHHPAGVAFARYCHTNQHSFRNQALLTSLNPHSSLHNAVELVSRQLVLSPHHLTLPTKDRTISDPPTTACAVPPPHPPNMSNINYRTVNVDVYDPETSINFPLQSVLPSSLPASSTASETAQLAQQIRQLLRAGDSLGALQSALETAPLAGDDQAKQVHQTTVLEVLQGTRQSDVNRILTEMLKQPGGNALGDTLMKYIYKGMATSSGGGGNRGMSPQTTGAVDGVGGGGRISMMDRSRNFGEGGSGQVMSVLLSWHEKLVEIVGVGGIVRVMSDRRTV